MHKVCRFLQPWFRFFSVLAHPNNGPNEASWFRGCSETARLRPFVQPVRSLHPPSSERFRDTNRGISLGTFDPPREDIIFHFAVEDYLPLGAFGSRRIDV